MASPRMKRMSIIGSTMILVIAPFCLYYLFFVQSQNEYFTRRNFRVLAGIGSQMKSKIDQCSKECSAGEKRNRKLKRCKI